MIPHAIDQVTLAFPADVEHLMPTDPEYEEYRKDWSHRDTWGFKLFSDWFYKGLAKLEMKPRDGIVEADALRHISAIMRSFQPQHEDKTAACAYLFEHWFESATWEVKAKISS